MARWISLSTFKELYSKETELLIPEKHADFMSKLQSDSGDAIREVEKIGMSDFLQFIATVQQAEGVVFHGWVSQSKELEDTLNSQQVTGKFRDARGALNHTLTENFRKFISPFLAPILLRDIPEEITKLADYLSFAQLLEVDTRATVEAQLFKPVRGQLQSLKNADTLASEQSLIDVVKPLCADSFIESMNYLSKRSYSLKMEYVDSIMEAIRSNACTVRFANWILKQMERLELNKEHELKLVDLRRELAQGKLNVKRMESTVSGARARPILILIFTVLVIIAGLFIIIFKPFSQADVYHAYDSANADFTEEELAKIDSLSLEIDKESFMEGRMIDPDIIIQTGTSITLRQPFVTPLMERIFSDVNKDVTLKENYYNDSCGASVSFSRYPGVKDLATKTGSKEIQFRNDSEYDLIVYVTNNKSSGSVYSMLVEEGDLVKFKMDVNDVLTTVAGKRFMAFIPPLGSFAEEKPSSDFRHHFCETDQNYFESINTALKLKSTSRDMVKFMVTGSSVSEFQLIDVYGMAEAY